jgi:hypothetical protein
MAHSNCAQSTAIHYIACISELMALTRMSVPWFLCKIVQLSCSCVLHEPNISYESKYKNKRDYSQKMLVSNMQPAFTIPTTGTVSCKKSVLCWLKCSGAPSQTRKSHASWGISWVVKAVNFGKNWGIFACVMVSKNVRYSRYVENWFCRLRSVFSWGFSGHYKYKLRTLFIGKLCFIQQEN